MRKCVDASTSSSSGLGEGGSQSAASEDETEATEDAVEGRAGWRGRIKREWLPCVEREEFFLLSAAEVVGAPVITSRLPNDFSG